MFPRSAVDTIPEPVVNRKYMLTINPWFFWEQESWSIVKTGANHSMLIKEYILIKDIEPQKLSTWSIDSIPKMPDNNIENMAIQDVAIYEF